MSELLNTRRTVGDLLRTHSLDGQTFPTGADVLHETTISAYL